MAAIKKNIAVVSYDLNSTSTLTADAIVIQNDLIAAGFNAKLITQWAFNEPDTADFKNASFWSGFDGIVICNFYGSWNLRELILSQKPVICINSGYADDLGLGEFAEEHISESSFHVTNNTHPITSGIALGAFNIPNAVWLDSISSFNHYVDVLITSLANQPVLVAHKSKKIAYFGWYRMSQAGAGSILNKLLVKTAQWAFN